jgi:hypothetical protein
MLLLEELDEYFVDTLIPMAHSLQIVLTVEYCVRWVIEYAILSVLLHAEKQEMLEDLKARMRVLVVQEQTAADQWRDRYSVQILDISLCSLRGVYDIASASAAHEPAACDVKGQTVTGCVHHYYTSACLLFCDGVFYNPCLCESNDSVCQLRLFDPSQCSAGALVDGRSILASEEGLVTISLLWPLSKFCSNQFVANNTQWGQVLSELDIVHSFSKFDTVTLDNVFGRAREELLDCSDSESVPHSYCDYLLDYWPDVQHPVGYHPTTACTVTETHTRGFFS